MQKNDKMNKELLIRSSSNNVDFALLKDGKLIEFHKDNDNTKFLVGDIYLAKIRKTMPCLLYTSPSPRDISGSRMPSSA